MAHEIAGRLAAAQERFEKATTALRAQWQPAQQQEYWAAHAALLVLERELAAARGEEHAVPLDFPVKWDAGAPLPHLLRSDYQALLAFCVREHDPGPAAAAVAAPDPADPKARLLALVEFEHCLAAKLGAPNDEVFAGHPLHGRGLDAYSAQQVKNSRWLAELETINKVHHCYDPARWRGRVHYVLWFHDTTFECIATGFKVEVYRETMAAMLARMARRILR
jgi:hypothetical protein